MDATSMTTLKLLSSLILTNYVHCNSSPTKYMFEIVCTYVALSDIWMFRPVSTYSGADIGNFFIQSSLSSCGTYLASGSSDNNVYIWNTESPGGPVAALGPQVSVHQRVTMLRSRVLISRYRLEQYVRPISLRIFRVDRFTAILFLPNTLK